MNKERERVRCRNCELVQWRERVNCRRCGVALPAPIVTVIEHVIEKIVIAPDQECVAALEQAQKLIETVTDRLNLQPFETASLLPSSASFPTMADVEQAMIRAAYLRSNRRPVEAARLLGIGKTTFHRKLRELPQARDVRSVGGAGTWPQLT